MIDFLNFLIGKIVDHPDDVVISETALGDHSFQYTIKAHTDDVGKIIGREGKIIHAIRNIAKILAVKENAQIRIEIA